MTLFWANKLVEMFSSVWDIYDIFDVEQDSTSADRWVVASVQQVCGMDASFYLLFCETFDVFLVFCGQDI